MVLMTPRENALIAYRHETPEWIPCFYTDIGLVMANPTMERYCGFGTGTDAFGVSWTYVPSITACMTTPGAEPVLKDVRDWKKVVKFPDLEAVDWEKQAEIDIHTNFGAFVAGAGLIPFENGGTALDGGKLGVCMVINGPFERLHALMGMENALISLVTEPEACYEFFGAMADYKIAYYKKIAQYYPVDVINAHDDYGTNDRMFMSPETWRRLLKPHLKRIVDAVHDMGLIYQHHTCGYIEPIFEDFVEIGVDAIDTLQACNKNVGELKKKYGKQITFCGGFDTNGVLDRPGVTPEEIKAEYRRVIDLLAPGGSYVIYPIGGTFDFVPAFLEEHFQYGMGFYKNPANR
jgi:hypothetical protein